MHLEEIKQYPQWLIEDYVRVCQWATATGERYQGQVLIRIIDYQSLAGLWRVLRYWIRKYPTFLLDGQKFVGWEEEPALQEAIQARLKALDMVESVDLAAETG